MHQFFGGEVCLFGFAVYWLRRLRSYAVYGLRRLRASLFMGFAAYMASPVKG